MANTYSQITIQLIFAVQHRQCLIHNSFEQDVHKYITGIFKNLDQKLFCINGMPNHLYILFGLNPDTRISDIVRDVKRFSTKYINENQFVRGKFSWQEGYSAFSYSKSQRDIVIEYIMNQKEHHKKKSFREEYVEFLEKFDVDYKEEYLFDWLEEESKENV